MASSKVLPFLHIASILSIFPYYTLICATQSLFFSPDICSRQSFKNSRPDCFISIRRKGVIHFSIHFFFVVYFILKRRESFNPYLGNIKRFHQLKCFFIEEICFFIST